MGRGAVMAKEAARPPITTSAGASKTVTAPRTPAMTSPFGITVGAHPMPPRRAQIIHGVGDAEGSPLSETCHGLTGRCQRCGHSPALRRAVGQTPRQIDLRDPD